MGSNISRDHIAMEAMKVLMEKQVSVSLSLKNKIKRFFGKDHQSAFAIDCRSLAAMSYRMADAMIAQREKTGEGEQ